MKILMECPNNILTNVCHSVLDTESRGEVRRLDSGSRIGCGTGFAGMVNSTETNCLEKQGLQTVSLTIDGREITAREGQRLLWVALDNGIYIPNLCALRDKDEPETACRLCFIEVAGKKQPVTACTETVSDGMVVNTRGEEALRLARSGFELLMASHPVDCGHCSRNGSCELQKLARHLGVRLKSRRLRKLLRELPIDDSHPLFIYDPDKCVLCGRCVWVCRERLGSGVLGLAYRGFRRMVTTFAGEPLGKSGCEQCGECVTVCPTGALVFKESENAEHRQQHIELVNSKK